MLELTDNAIARINQTENKVLRITIAGGGCSGFQYMFEWSEVKDGDLVFSKNGATVVSDPLSLEMIDGSTIDFKEDLVGSRFVVKNPQAASSCGCGSSFS